MKAASGSEMTANWRKALQVREKCRTSLAYSCQHV